MTDTPEPGKAEPLWLPNPAFPGEQTMIYRDSSTRELAELSRNSQRRVFRVRVVISDQGQPLNWSLEEALTFRPKNRIRLTDGQFSVWKHYGGNRAVFHDFCTDESGNFFAVEVDVSAIKPELALGYARAAVNQLLDSLTLQFPHPMVILRLELLSQRGRSAVLAYQITMPNQFSTNLGRFGGFWPGGPFPGAEAIFREAATNSSPYYRLLLAYRGFEGIRGIRRQLTAFVRKHSVVAPELQVMRLDKTELAQHGFDREVQNLETIDNLIDYYRVLRDGVAHFFLGTRGQGARAHLHLSRTTGHTCAKVSALMLEYLRRELAGLKVFHMTYIAPVTHRGMILPMESVRERYMVICPDDEATAPPDEFS